MSCGQYSTREINITIFIYIKATYIYIYWIVNGQFFYILYFMNQLRNQKCYQVEK